MGHKKAVLDQASFRRQGTLVRSVKHRSPEPPPFDDVRHVDRLVVPDHLAKLARHGPDGREPVEDVAHGVEKVEPEIVKLLAKDGVAGRDARQAVRDESALLRAVDRPVRRRHAPIAYEPLGREREAVQQIF